MAPAHEFLAAAGPARQHLVLLHGWGVNREVWRPLVSRLRPWADITLLDLPGCAPGVAPPAGGALDSLLSGILDCCPERAIYLGWSLGGQLAMALAEAFPERVIAVVTLASNPRFVAGDDWPGMASADFAAFRESVVTAPETALRRFHSLQAQGARHARQHLRQLRSLRRDRAGEELLTGLDWLAGLDQRRAWGASSIPRLHLFAECDELLPVACMQALANAAAQQRRAHVQLIRDSGHLLPVAATAQVESALAAFLEAEGLLWPAPEQSPEAVAKTAVAESFSRAAATYDTVAHLQREVGERLLAQLDEGVDPPGTLLDLGCGTGYFRAALGERFPAACYVGLDIAEGMVQFARTRNEGQWLVGDAESLPLASGSVDLVFSSLALQWCYQPALLLAELARVLRPGGRCVFTTLGPDTLRELRAAWATVDDRRHVNTFLPPSELQSAASRLSDVTLQLDSERFCLRYDRVRELLDELKGLGAHNMNRGRLTGLTGRRALQGMLAAYESWREDGQLPASYEVIYGVLEKS